MPLANLALKFFLELAAVLGAAIGGWHAGGWLGALLAPIVFVLAWGLLAAPKAPYRLPTPVRVPFEFLLLAGAFGTYGWAGHPLAAVVLCVLLGLNFAMLALFEQWEE